MATTDEIASSYANLLINQYQGKPKAYATIKAVVTPFLIDQMPLEVQAGYDLDTAVGAQLVTLAKELGLTSPYPGQSPRVQRDFSGQVILSDDDLRQLVKIIVISNYGKTDLASIQSLISRFFAGAVQVFDHQNMTGGYFFDVTFGSVELAEIIVRNNYLPKPMCVRLNAVTYAVDVLTTGFFGMARAGETPPLSVGFMNAGDDPTGRFLTTMEAISL